MQTAGASGTGGTVAVWGYVRQASDNGAAVVHAGEREIVASLITVNSTDNALPTPVTMTNKNVGGGSLADDGWRDSVRGVTNGSHPAGVRIRMSKDMFDSIAGFCGDITDLYVTVIGIASATSGTDLTSSTNGGIARNVRGVRLRASTDFTFIW